MARKAPPQEEGGGNEWMNTYADLVTLLMCFFVLLFSMSSIDAAKFEQLVQGLTASGTSMSDMMIAIDGSAGTEGDKKPNETGNMEGLGNSDTLEEMPTSFDDILKFLAATVVSENLQETVEISAEGENTIMIRFKDTMMFRPNTSTLLPQATKALSPIGDALKAMEEYIEVIRVDGHCSGDVTQTGKFTWDLSTNRANTVLYYLIDQKKFEPTMLFSMGFGKYKPIAPNNGTEAERAKNRRVELYVKRKGMDLSDPDLLMDYFTMGYEVQDFEETAIGEEVFGTDTSTVPTAPATGG